MRTARLDSSSGCPVRPIRARPGPVGRKGPRRAGIAARVGRDPLRHRTNALWTTSPDAMRRSRATWGPRDATTASTTPHSPDCGRRQPRPRDGRGGLPRGAWAEQDRLRKAHGPDRGESAAPPTRPRRGWPVSRSAEGERGVDGLTSDGPRSLVVRNELSACGAGLPGRGTAASAGAVRGPSAAPRSSLLRRKCDYLCEI